MTDKDIANYIYRLFSEHETLHGLEKEIKSLFDLCQSDHEFQIIRHVLSNLNYLSQPRYLYLVRLMVDRIIELSEDDHSWAVVTCAYDHNPDGSQRLLQDMKPFFRRNREIGLFNNLTLFLRKMLEYDRFVLIDDFSGTGGTVVRQFNHILKDAQARGHTIEGRAFVLAGMENARQSIESEGISVEFVNTYRAGISGFFEGCERIEMTNAMLRVETELGPEFDGEPLPSFGFGKAEALYGVVGQNAPNSNFPVLWWPLDKNENERTTLMVRYES